MSITPVQASSFGNRLSIVCALPCTARRRHISLHPGCEGKEHAPLHPYFFSIAPGSGGRTQWRKPQRAHTNTSALLASQSVSKNVSAFVFNKALRLLNRSWLQCLQASLMPANTISASFSMVVIVCDCNASLKQTTGNETAELVGANSHSPRQELFSAVSFFRATSCPDTAP